MNILITGNLGYVGSVLVPYLRRHLPGSKLIGCDPGWFAHCLTGADRAPETCLDRHWFRDYRDVRDDELYRIDAIVHLAAVSNDAGGERFARATEEINFQGSARLAKVASQWGVKKFVFASSCSVYGTAGDAPRAEDAEPNPLTAYASSKINTEAVLDCLEGRGTALTSLRFATACGPSPRLRTDLVLNWMVSDAVIDGRVTVHGDGLQVRPLVDVRDMCRAVEWALTREKDDHVVVNVGDVNYTINDIARTVSETLDVPTEREDRAPDRRSYRVCFDKFKALAPDHQPQFTLAQTVSDIVDAARGLCGHKQARLAVLADHVASGRLGEDLRWR